MSFFGRTRPDAPVIPQDLATKLYVDDAGIVGAYFIMGQEDILGAFHGVGFYSPFDRTSDSTEAAAQMPMTNANTLIGHNLNIQFNTNTTGNSLFNFRDDGADLNTLTVAFGVTGQFVSGLLSDSIAAGSLVNFSFFTTDGDGSILLKEWSEHDT